MRSLKRRREMGYRHGSGWAAAEPHYYEARGMAAPEGGVPAVHIPAQTTAATAYRVPKRAAGAAFLARRRTALTVVGIVAGASVPAFALVAALTAPSMHAGDLNNVTADGPSVSVPAQGARADQQPAVTTQDSDAAQQAAEVAAAQQAADQQAADQQAAAEQAAARAASEATRSTSAADPAAVAPAAPMQHSAPAQHAATTPKHVITKAPAHPAAPTVHSEPSRPTRPARSDQHGSRSDASQHSSHSSHASHHPSVPATSTGGATFTGTAPSAPTSPTTPSGPSVTQDPADPGNNSSPQDPAQDPSNPDYGADNPSAPAPATPQQPVSDPATPAAPAAPSAPAAQPVTQPPVATKHSGERFEPRDTEPSMHSDSHDSGDPSQPTNG
ncbi:MAG TPA: hypothetical protein VGJ14_00675 [Sporichthyaceae bacterium]|jgi:hypothetical protein